MRKKAVWIISLLLVVVLIGSSVIRDVVQKQKREKKYNDAFNELFVTERNEVYLLYEAIAAAIKTPDKEHYDNAYNVAVRTEQICRQVFSDLSDDVTTYGAGLVYYTTFYRDIKAAITSNCDTDVLRDIYELLGKILSLYDAPYSKPVETKDKMKAVRQFYESLSLLNEDMELCNTIL